MTIPKYTTNIVPSSYIRQKELHKAMEKNDAELVEALKWSGDMPAIRDLPKGIRLFMNQYPQQFDNYLREIKAEQKYLQAIKNNVVGRLMKGGRFGINYWREVKSRSDFVLLFGQQ